MVGCQTFEYNRDNNMEAPSNLKMHQVKVPFPQIENSQKVYIDLSVLLVFSLTVIAAALSWRGATDLNTSSFFPVDSLAPHGVHITNTVGYGLLGGGQSQSIAHRVHVLV